MKTTKIGLVWIGLLIVMAFVILLFARCSHTKDIVKTENRQEDSRVKSLEDSLHLVISERDLFEQHYNELLYGSVLFDTVTVHDSIINTVFISREGEIKASGNIRKVDLSKNIINSIIKEKDRTIDSLKAVKQKENYITKTVTVTKDKHTKTSFLNWLLWLLLGFVIGKWGKQIFNYAKNKIYG